MPDRAPARPVPARTVPLLLLALVVLSGATGVDDGAASGGGTPLASIALLVIGVIVGVTAVVVIAYLILRWRAGPTPAEIPGDWWTCPSCGAANIVGSPRCHACGAWPR